MLGSGRQRAGVSTLAGGTRAMVKIVVQVFMFSITGGVVGYVLGMGGRR